MKNKRQTRTGQKGNVWVGVLILLTFLITTGVALISDATVTLTQAKRQKQIVVAQTLAEAGIEKAIWKLNSPSGFSYNGELNISLTGGVIDVAVFAIDSENKTIESTAYVPDKTNPGKVTRTVRTKVNVDLNRVSFNYGIQVGSKGLNMDLFTNVNGNVYSNGPIDGDVLLTSHIHGDTFAAGSTNSINHMYVTGNARAQTIHGSLIQKDAYYQNISSTVVQGIQHPNTDPPPTVPLPLTDTDINEWKTWSQEPYGTTFVGNMDINNATRTIGPVYITGNLNITNGSTVTLNGPVYVRGNVTITGTLFRTTTVKLAPMYGTKSGSIIADGTIRVSLNVNITGSGNSQSYIMLLSTADPSPNPAIEVEWGSNGVVYYAQKGIVELIAFVSVRSVTGEGVRLLGFVDINYLNGLSDLNFSGGPGASWTITEWQVVP